MVFSDEFEERFFGRGRVEYRSPTDAFCLFSVGRDDSSVTDVVIFLADVRPAVGELLPASPDNDDIGMSIGEVERTSCSLDSTLVDDDGVNMSSSVSMCLGGDFAPMEGLVGCR